MFSIIPKNQIIRNIISPLCKECVYFKNSSKIMYSPCMKYGEKNVITGEVTYDNVIMARNDESKCGVNGNGFEKINAGNHMVSYNHHKNNTFDNPGC